MKIPKPYTYALDDFNFAVAGDWGCKPSTVDTVNNIVSKNPYLVLALGDYSYNQTASCWFNIIKPLDNITRINFGNHEVKTLHILNEYMSHFGLESQYYSYDYEGVHFLTISTELPFLQGSPQHDFIEKDLLLASQDPDIKWIIVNFHKHIYAAGHQADISRRDILHPLFDKYDVDLVLQGHNHNYQRTFPIKYNAMNSSTPIITNKDLNDYVNPDGVIIVTVGTGGQVVSSPKLNASFVSFKQYSSFGFLDVKLIKNGTKLQGTFFANDGAIEDSFSITRQ